MTTSRFSLVVAGIVSGIVAAVADSTVGVYDGPVIAPGDVNRYFLVGADDTDGDVTAGSFTQTWAALGQRARDEMTDVECLLVVWSGDEASFAGVRDSAFGLLATVEAYLRGNGIQLGGVPGVLWVEVTSGSVRQANTDHGPLVRIPFTVHARSRI